MMVNAKLKQFKAVTGAALSIILAACTSFPRVSAKPNPTPSPAATPTVLHESPTIPSVVHSDGADFTAELSSAKVVDGGFLLLTVQGAGLEKNADSLTVKMGDTPLMLYPLPERGAGVYQAMIPIPHDSKPGRRSLTINRRVSAAILRQAVNLDFEVISGNYPSETLTVDEKQVNPPAKVMKRIEKEVAETAAIYKARTPTRYWRWPFALPLTSAPITSPFGGKRTYNGATRSFHAGQDFRAKTGTPIFAPASGVVALAKNLYFTGNTVMIDHGYGLITLYAHMSQLAVKKGDLVQVGQQLGRSGATGRVTGPHLHWGAVMNQVKINPMGLVKARP